MFVKTIDKTECMFYTGCCQYEIQKTHLETVLGHIGQVFVHTNKFNNENQILYIVSIEIIFFDIIFFHPNFLNV